MKLLPPCLTSQEVAAGQIHVHGTSLSIIQACHNDLVELRFVRRLMSGGGPPNLVPLCPTSSPTYHLSLPPFLLRYLTSTTTLPTEVAHLHIYLEVAPPTMWCEVGTATRAQGGCHEAQAKQGIM